MLHRYLSMRRSGSAERVSRVQTDYIVAQHVTKTYKGRSGARDHVSVISDLSLTIPERQFAVLFGPNGCGKTTLLNLLAGVTAPDTGTLLIGAVPPVLVNCGYVFQNYAASLLPWRTVRDNIALPLELRGVPFRDRAEEVNRFLADFNISLPLDRHPYQLSGGQQQLLAIARALIGRPRVLLLDEPFNQLDYQWRRRLHDHLLDLWRSTGVTTVMVSHDLEEALSLGDRVLFLSRLAGGIVADISTNNPKERRHDIITSEDFRQLLGRAMEIVNAA